MDISKADQKAVIVGISGCSSSGKTTLARLLRDIFPNTFILHEDDFYKPEEQLPMKDGLRDWDCPEAISIPDMEAALAYIRRTGTFPVSSTSPSSSPSSPVLLPPLPSRRSRSRSDHGCIYPNNNPPLFDCSPLTSQSRSHNTQPDVNSKEDKNSVGASPITPDQIATLKSRVQSWLQPGHPGHAIFSTHPGLRICLLDGFLLYQKPDFATIMSELDVKLFLTVSRQKATQRREARDGYVTLEGFWKDPPGYVDKIVWPNYVQAHKWLFVDGDVEGGKLDEETLRREGIKAQIGKGQDVDFRETLEWAVGAVMEALERRFLNSNSQAG
ncbi:nicotinamide riboside kinase [Diplogelasinospora grovesii]|uniref:Nicotinamide riboside kinase n=1 Tax=Diplogelasinospora grovesii TaxID=303347 RepID=A0AAN6S726_9PEZI|nr:nicotinamide riboside kinase [Diplogelasinospora grovesii]